MLGRRRLVALRRGEERGQLDPGGGDLVPDRLQLLEGAVAGVTEEDRVRVAEHAEQRTAAAAVLRGSLDQAGDLDELDEHAAQARRRRDRTCRGERIVGGADLDRRERLQK